MRMPNLQTAVILLIVLSANFSTDIGHCLPYYVKNSGDDSSHGLTPKGAWKTIKKVNQFKFKNGDIVLFKRGDIFDDSTLKSPEVDDFTFADYGDPRDPLPLFHGNHIKPVYIKGPIKNLTIKNIDISGQNWQYRKSSNLQIKSVIGILIQGVVGNGHFGSTVSEGKTAISLKNCSGNIVIENCHLHNWGPPVIPSVSKDFMGIAILDMMSGSLVIRGNKIHNINADCIHFKNCTPETAIVHDNKLFNAGENAIDCKGIHNLRIRDNQIYREKFFLGKGGNRRSQYQPSIVVHFVPKTETKNFQHGLPSGNIRIFKNTFFDLQGPGITLAGHKNGHVQDIRIFQNLFQNTKGCIHIRNWVMSTSIYSNLGKNPMKLKTKHGDIGGIYVNNIGRDIAILHNTITSTEGTLETGINLQATGRNTRVINNIVFINNASAGEHLLKSSAWPSAPLINHNCWFNKSGNKIIAFKGNTYTKKNFYQWKQIRSGEICDDPKLYSTGALRASSPCIDSGENVGVTHDFEGKSIPQNSPPDIGAFTFIE